MHASFHISPEKKKVSLFMEKHAQNILRFGCIVKQFFLVFIFLYFTTFDSLVFLDFLDFLDLLGIHFQYLQKEYHLRNFSKIKEFLRKKIMQNLVLRFAILLTEFREKIKKYALLTKIATNFKEKIKKWT